MTISDHTVGVGDATSGATWAIVWGGLAAAAIEMIPVLAIQGLALGVPPLRIFQAIASGVLGANAYDGGVGSAVLGAFLHLVISLGAAAVFVAAASRVDWLARRPLAAGPLFGIAVWFVMTYVVVPFSLAAFKPATNPALIAVSILVHMFAFALPIALVCRRVLAR